MLEQHGEGRESGVEERQPAPADQARSGQRREKKKAQAARNASAGVHQHDDEADVGRDLDHQEEIEMPARADQAEAAHAEEHVGHVDDEEERHVVGAEPQRVAPDRDDQEQQ
jgi:hypothetical protein